MAGSADLVQGLVPSSSLPGPVGEALVLHGAQVDPSATLTGGATVGAGAVIGADAVIDGSVLFDGAVVEAGAVVRRSVIGFGGSVGAGALLEDTVVGDRARIGARRRTAGRGPGVARHRRPRRGHPVLVGPVTLSAQRDWDAGRPVDLAATLGPLRRGTGDPAHLLDTAGVFWWACATPDGDGTLAVRVRGSAVTGRAWGPGRDWLLERLPALLGADDDWSGLDLARRTAVA